MFLLVFDVQAMLVSIVDQTNQNRFLGEDYHTCDISGRDSYACGNGAVSGLLHINFLSLQNYGKQFYMFNDFVSAFQAQSQAEEYDTTALRYSATQVEDKLKKDFPAAGIYMIVIGTSDYLKKIIAPFKICPAGQSPIMAQLKYNDGNLVYSWSQDALCLSPNDSFALQITSEADATIPHSVDGTPVESNSDAQGIDWMKDSGPSSVYNKATKSPRKIRLIKK